MPLRTLIARQVAGVVGSGGSCKPKNSNARSHRALMTAWVGILQPGTCSQCNSTAVRLDRLATIALRRPQSKPNCLLPTLCKVTLPPVDEWERPPAGPSSAACQTGSDRQRPTLSTTPPAESRILWSEKQKRCQEQPFRSSPSVSATLGSGSGTLLLRWPGTLRGMPSRPCRCKRGSRLGMLDYCVTPRSTLRAAACAAFDVWYWWGWYCERAIASCGLALPWNHAPVDKRPGR